MKWESVKHSSRQKAAVPVAIILDSFIAKRGYDPLNKKARLFILVPLLPAFSRLAWLSSALCFFLCLSGLPGAAKNQAEPAKPEHVLADEGARDASFAGMRRRLLVAIKNHDKSFVENMLSPDVMTALKGEAGKAGFETLWHDLLPDSSFWERLQRVLVHGAQYDGESDEYHAPAVSFDDSHSSLPQAVVWNKNAGLFKSKEDNLPLLRLYDEQITLMEPSSPEPIKSNWARITTSRGSKGFIKTENIYSAYDEFAVFRKVNGKWCLSWFGYACL